MFLNPVILYCMKGKNMKHTKKFTTLLALTLLLSTACGITGGIDSQKNSGNTIQASELEKDGTNKIKDIVNFRNLSVENLEGKIHKAATPPVAKEASPENAMKKIGDVVTYQDYFGAEIEFTVQKAEIFDHYTETGIPESEFSFGISNGKMIMLDVKVKKVSGPAWTNEDDNDNISVLSLYNQSMLDKESQGGSALMSEICYFSGHGDVNKEGKGYNRYYLAPGEEAVFQVAWCLHEPLEGKETNVAYLNDTEGLTLHVYNGEYIDLTT